MSENNKRINIDYIHLESFKKALLSKNFLELLTEYFASCLLDGVNSLLPSMSTKAELQFYCGRMMNESGFFTNRIETHEIDSLEFLSIKDTNVTLKMGIKKLESISSSWQSIGKLALLYIPVKHNQSMIKISFPYAHVAGIEIPHEDNPQFFTLLLEVGEYCDIRLQVGENCPISKVSFGILNKNGNDCWTRIRADFDD